MNGRRALLLAVLASLIVGFAGGLVAGVLFARATLHDRPRFARADRRPPASAHARGWTARTLARRLDLDRDQTERVERILRESRGRLDSLRAGTHRALQAELTPEQRERWERINEHTFRRRPPPGRGPPEERP